MERLEEEAQASGEKEITFRQIHRRGGGGGGGRGRDDDGDDEEEASAKWTLRKQAALVLDNLAVTLSAAAVLPHALPAIQHKLQAPTSAAAAPAPAAAATPGSHGHVPGPDDGVWQRESGMLALGALSTGCMHDMGPYLPQLFPFLVQNLAEPVPEMRSIACWVLSRYCTWIFEDEALQVRWCGSLPTEACLPAHAYCCVGGPRAADQYPSHPRFLFSFQESGAAEPYFVQMLEGLLHIMLDTRPKVQSACCSALCILVRATALCYHPSHLRAVAPPYLCEHPPAPPRSIPAAVAGTCASVVRRSRSRAPTTSHRTCRRYSRSRSARSRCTASRAPSSSST